MYDCKYCGKECKNANSLRNHERRCSMNPSVQLIVFNCRYCGRQCIGEQALHKHERHCKSNPSRIPQADSKSSADIISGLCSYCGKFCKNQNSLRNHERCCKENPDRQLTNAANPDWVAEMQRRAHEKPIWNKGLTKETDSRIKDAAQKVSEGYASGRLVASNKGKPISESHRQTLSKLARSNQYEKHFGRRKIFECRGFKFISSYEVDVAKSLDENNIKWIQPKRFPYKDLKGKLHYYTPDLYLPDYDIYLDPKNDFLIEHENPKFGYKDTDKIKWVEEYNNIKVIVLNKNQLNWTIIKKLIEEYK